MPKACCVADTARRRAALAVAWLALAGCGGGGDPGASAPPAAAPVPTPAPSPSPSPTSPPAAGLPAGYRLVWFDEFDLDGLPDTQRWGYDTERNPFGWYNGELQYYAAARYENTLVSDGRLRITARRESLAGAADWGGQRYTSARLVTRGKAQWTYGFFEVRAKLPCGRGTWPAIWMLGAGGRWPDDGEIDIMEQVGSQPTRILGTVHTPITGGSGNGSSTTTSCTGRPTGSRSASTASSTTAMPTPAPAARPGPSMRRSTCCSTSPSAARSAARWTTRSSR